MLDTPLTRSPFLARSDPRVRLVAALACAVCLSTLGSAEAAGAALMVAVAALACSRPLLRPVLSRLLAVNAFILFLALGLSVGLTPGEGWLPGLTLVDNRPLIALVALKANAIACSFMLLIGSMAPQAIGYAMGRLRVPSSLVCLFLFTLRFIHAIVEEYARLMAAARLRGFRPGTSAHCYRTLATLLGVLLMRSWQRAQRVREAMLLRGFNGRFRIVTGCAPGWRDSALASMVTAALAAVLCLDMDVWPPAGDMAARLADLLARFLA